MGLDIKKINGNELHGSKRGKGWEQCSHPISNDEVWLTPGERRLLETITSEYGHCPACLGDQLMFLGAIGEKEYHRCRDCGVTMVGTEVIDA